MRHLTPNNKKSKSNAPKRNPSGASRASNARISLTPAEAAYVDMCADPFGDALGGVPGRSNIAVRPSANPSKGQVQLVVTHDLSLVTDAGGDMLLTPSVISNGGGLRCCLNRLTSGVAGTYNSESTTYAPSDALLIAMLPSAATNRFHIDAAGVKVWSSAAATAATGIMTGGVSTIAPHPSGFTTPAIMQAHFGSENYYNSNEGITVRYSPSDVGSHMTMSSLATSSATDTTERPCVQITGLVSAAVFVRCVWIISIEYDTHMPLPSITPPTLLHPDSLQAVLGAMPSISKGHSFGSFLNRAKQVLNSVAKGVVQYGPAAMRIASKVAW